MCFPSSILLFICILSSLNISVFCQTSASIIIATTTTAAQSGVPSPAISSIATAIPTTASAINQASDIDASVASLPTSSSYGNSVYPGAATFLTPTGTKSVSPLFRINSKENVTFVWSFTDLLVQPQTLNLAAVAPNSLTYTITAMNGAATSAVWHLSDVPAASPLMMGLYTIQLYDQRGVSAVASPGWLSPVTSLKIALYSPEAYSSVSTGSDYCPLCFYNSGRKIAEALGPISIALGVASITSAMILYDLFY